MVLQSEVNKHVYTGNGSNKLFDYTFDILSTSHLHIYKTGLDGIASEVTTDYTIDTTTQKVTYPVIADALTSDYQLTLIREVPLEQLTDYNRYGPFDAETVETALDKITMIAQQLSEQVGRSLKFSVEQEISDATIADPVDGEYLQWSGNNIVSSTGPTSTVNSSTISTLIGPSIAVEAGTTFATLTIPENSFLEVEALVSGVQGTTTITKKITFLITRDTGVPAVQLLFGGYSIPADSLCYIDMEVSGNDVILKGYSDSATNWLCNSVIRCLSSAVITIV